MTQVDKFLLRLLGVLYGLVVIGLIMLLPLACIDSCPSGPNWIGYAVSMLFLGYCAYASWQYAGKGPTVGRITKVAAFLPVVLTVLGFFLSRGFGGMLPF